MSWRPQYGAKPNAQWPGKNACGDDWVTVAGVLRAGPRTLIPKACISRTASVALWKRKGDHSKPGLALSCPILDRSAGRGKSCVTIRQSITCNLYVYYHRCYHSSSRSSKQTWIFSPDISLVMVSPNCRSAWVLHPRELLKLHSSSKSEICLCMRSERASLLPAHGN